MVSTNLFGLLVLATGITGVYRLTMLFVRSRAAAVAAVGVFFLAPFIINHRGYFDLQYAFLFSRGRVHERLARACHPQCPRRVQVVRLLVCFT